MKNIPDSLVLEALGRIGEAPPPGNTRGRWGQRLAMGNGQPKQKTMIATDVFPRPVPFAVLFRFSTDGVTFTPDVPAGFTGGQVVIDVLKGIDEQSTPGVERIFLDPGETVPFCNVIAQSLQIVAGISVEGPSSLWIEVVATLVNSIDCAEIVGPAAAVPGIVSTTTTRFAAVTANTYNLAANAARGLLTVVNQSAANLFLHLGVGVTITPGAEFATVILPPDAIAGYEVTNYRGQVYLRFDADDASGYTLVTEGFYV